MILQGGQRVEQIETAQSRSFALSVISLSSNHPKPVFGHLHIGKDQWRFDYCFLSRFYRAYKRSRHVASLLLPTCNFVLNYAHYTLVAIAQYVCLEIFHSLTAELVLFTIMVIFCK